MKALSLRQPWCNAVLYLGKHIENRTWWTSFRGEFLIHASKTFTEEEYEAAIDTAEDALGVERCNDIEAAFGRGYSPQKKTLHLGGIVGRARLVDVVRPRPSGRIPFDENVAGIEAHYPPSVRRTPDLWRWHMQAQYGFVLEDVSPVPFVPCRGFPSFFDVPEEVIDELVVRGIEEMASAITESWWRRYAVEKLAEPFKLPQSMRDNLDAAGIPPDATDEEVAAAIARRNHA